MNWKEFLRPNWRKILILIVIYLIVLIFVFNNSYAMFSNSMVPTINQGDLAFYEKVPYEQLKVNDIIIFNAPQRKHPLLHRIYNITNDGIITKGDNNPVPNSWIITSDEIVGKVTFWVPLIGYVFITSSSIADYPLNSIIATLIFLIFYYLLSCLIVWIYDKVKKK